jgi:thioredoxin-related protein
MKTILSILIFLPLWLTAQIATDDLFDRTQSWEQLKKEAAVEKKYLFVDLYTTWCGPCKMMDRDVYSNDSVKHILRENFISVKVQMDSTSQDDEYVKAWYDNVQNIAAQYIISAYPSYLIFSPDNQLVVKDIGYKDVADFLNMMKKAVDPQRLQYISAISRYKAGERNYEVMGKLALFTKKVIEDKKLADSIAKDYKANYLDKKGIEELCTSDNLDFIGEFYNIINSNDSFFWVCYHEPKKVDSIKHYEGWAAFQVRQTVRREQIDDKILVDRLPKFKHPHWKEIENEIKRMYPQLDVTNLVLTYQVGYYRSIGLNWKLWAKYKNELRKRYPARPPYGLGIYVDLNVYGAWDAFLHCSDRKVLAEGVRWIDLALRLDPENKSAYLDTKANLLYKLGRQQEALPIEKEATMAAPKDQEIAATLKKMQKGERTWPVN